MSDFPCQTKPPLLFGCVVFTSLLLLIARGVFVNEGSPLSFAVDTDVVYVELGTGFESAGVHQFSDAAGWGSVISMTRAVSSGSWALVECCPLTIENGLYLEAAEEKEKATQIQCRWMPAEHRIALQIPLHPDRMSREDWIALPGIGEVLAERIELSRQKNGDFGCLEALQRVSGIGPKRIAAWNGFFESCN